MKHKYISGKKGFTSIEVIVALLITVIVFGALYAIYTWSYQTLDFIGDQSEIQQDTRITSIYITNEVSNAVEVDLLQSLPELLDSGYDYLYIDEEKDEEKNSLKVENTLKKKTLFKGNIVSVIFDLKEITDSTEYDYYLKYTISGTKDKREFEVESKIIMNNLKSENAEVETGNVIKYKNG